MGLKSEMSDAFAGANKDGDPKAAVAAQQGGRPCAADPGHSYPAEQGHRPGGADPEKADRDQRQARLVH